jgi:hypothetical protein
MAIRDFFMIKTARIKNRIMAKKGKIKPIKARNHHLPELNHGIRQLSRYKIEQPVLKKIKKILIIPFLFNACFLRYCSKLSVTAGNFALFENG